MLRTGFVLAVVAVVFVLAVLQLATAVSAAGTYQTNVREAQILRARVFRYQLDEETGVRGFAASGAAEFLEPYGHAKERYPDAFAALDAALGKLGLTQRVGGSVRDERELNARWLAVVAKPLIENSRRGDRAQIERTGKQITDRFRSDDRHVFDALIEAAASADAALNAAFVRIVVGAALAGVALVVAFLIFAGRRSELEREIALQRRLYEAEKQIADTLQAAFLQREFPRAPTLGLHAVYVPAGAQAQIGGDWYDAFKLPDGRVLFSLGDVAGHGLEAAVTMSRVRQAIIAGAVSTGDPAEILASANRSLMLLEDRMVTAVCGLVDTETLEITYALAGHPPPVLMQPGGAPEFLRFGGMALGLADAARYETYTARGSAGGILVLYTDGAVEYSRNIEMGERRLLESILARARDADPAAGIRADIFGTTVPGDDVAIMTISFLEVSAPVTV